METQGSFSFLELFKLGGIFMWPLLAFSVAVLGVILDRSFFFLRHDLRVDRLFPAVREHIRAGNLREAADLLERKAAVNRGAGVLLALVNHAELDAARLEKTAEAEAAVCIGGLEPGLALLAAAGSLAPLTGFLGTVSGMIGAFRSIAEADEISARIVAGGIYEALITTVFGLIIAIAALIAHYFFSGLVDRFAVRIEKACSDLLNALTQQKAKPSANGTSLHAD